MEQSALGTKTMHRQPRYTEPKLGRITSTHNYRLYGKVEVIFLDYSQPVPVWVMNDIDREPVEGDQVIVGFMDGRADAPYLQGFIRNNAYTSNFILVERDRIRLQLPVVDETLDIKDKLLTEANITKRAYIDITRDGIEVYHPTGKIKFN